MLSAAGVGPTGVCRSTLRMQSGEALGLMVQLTWSSVRQREAAPRGSVGDNRCTAPFTVPLRLSRVAKKPEASVSWIASVVGRFRLMK